MEVIQQINDTQMALENLVTASADGQLDFKTFKSSSVIAQTHKIDCPSGMINDEGICGKSFLFFTIIINTSVDRQISS